MGRSRNVLPGAWDPRSVVRARIRLLVERAQQAGVMRPGVAWQDVPFLLAAAATGPGTVGLEAGDLQWERNLQIILDGLRAPQPSPLPGTPPRAVTALR